MKACIVLGKCHKVQAAAMLLSVLCSWSSNVQGQSSDVFEAPLSVLASISVSVPSEAPEYREADINRIKLHSAIELQLRKAGIKVVSGEDAAGDLNVGVLVPSLDVMEHSSGSWVYVVHLALMQYVFVPDDSLTLIPGITWQLQDYGYCSRSALQEKIKESLLTNVDVFANLYLAVHSKKD